ncbi:MAG: LysR family transcriptional regulator [Litoreibacter sp.]|nr:LysR family transcriptional regulator [Litoreibacter sp.]
MIEKLRSIAIFATVVDQGSFRAAAEQLGLAPSRVSQAVSNLERDLGVTLLYRSTRHLSMTEQGRVLHAQAREMLNAVEIGLDALNPMTTEPVGLLRVSAPAFLTQTRFMDRLAGFAKAHPKVSLDLHFTDQRLDIIKDGFDVAIRAGWLEDSDFIARKIGEMDRLLVAHPDYVAGKARPKRPEDLSEWDWIGFSIRSDRTELTSRSGETVSITGRSNIKVSAADALYECAVRGLGLSHIPEDLARRGFARGELVHILPDWTLAPLGIYAVWPNQSRRENLTTIFARFLSEA